MAESTEQKDPAASGTAKAATPPRPAAREEEPTFHVDRLLSDEAYGITGQPAHVVAGALELAGGTKKNFTREEIGQLVEDFLAYEVPVDEGEEQ